MSVKVLDRDLGWKDFFKRISQIKESYAKVGVLGQGKGAEHEEGSALSVAEIAVILEYGTRDGHIPARPFLRSTFDAQRSSLIELGKKLMGEVLDGKITTDKALNIMGASLADAAKKTITAGVSPANAPATITKKGSSKPLVDTGRLLNAISWALIFGDKKAD